MSSEAFTSNPCATLESLRVAILDEFQHLGRSAGIKRHCVDVLHLRPGERGRRAHGADLHFGITKELRERLDLSCERPCVPILGLIGDPGKAQRHRRPGRLPVDRPQGCREAFLLRRQCRQLRFLGPRIDSLRRRLHRRPQPDLVQPRCARGCCERDDDAGQQQGPPTGHADRLNGAPSIYSCGYSIPRFPRRSTNAEVKQTCPHAWLAAAREPHPGGQWGSQVGVPVNRPPSAKPMP